MVEPALRPVETPLPEETPVAITCNGSAQAVMMATPRDLADFAWGFAWTEGLLSALGDVEHFEVLDHGAEGREARFWLVPERAAALGARRRRMAGPVGCGLCGIDSLREALRPPAALHDTLLSVPAREVAGATEALRRHQPLRARMRGLHAAGFLRPGAGIVLAREDVGRHNAVDKVCGALLRAGIDPAGGAIVTSSRVSVDLVQKCGAAGIPMLIAVSTPTALSGAAAEASGITLVARARKGAYEVFSRPDRIV